MKRLLVICLVLGCRPEGEVDPFVQPELTTPEIRSLRWLCDADRGRWQLFVTASSWTGGGWLFLTENSDYVERHRVRSRSAAEDGSRDNLRLDLPIAIDFRQARDGLTAFSCARDPDALFQLLDPDGQVVACERFGPDGAEDADWSEVKAARSCP